MIARTFAPAQGSVCPSDHACRPLHPVGGPDKQERPQPPAGAGPFHF
jgi:hypothetical protein